jgi:hypothetical protein
MTGGNSLIMPDEATSKLQEPGSLVFANENSAVAPRTDSMNEPVNLPPIVRQHVVNELAVRLDHSGFEQIKADVGVELMRGILEVESLASELRGNIEQSCHCARIRVNIQRKSRHARGKRLNTRHIHEKREGFL